MGKRNRQRKSSSDEKSGTQKPSAQQISELFELVKVVLEKSSKPLKGVKEEWENYKEIYDTIQMIRSKQAKYVMKRPTRTDCIPAFIEWLKAADVDTSTIEIHEFKEGLGLKATKLLPALEKFFTIPRKVVISSETASASFQESFMVTDRVLQAMSNVRLALHVLFEAHKADSFWKPYLDILPHTYNTPLYFGPEDVELLRGSPVFPDILNQYRSIARQYSYFFKLFKENSDSAKFPFELFTYDDYRWAASVVMTRQNQIPAESGSGQVLALIPLWDMCNHTEGQFSTDFNVKTNCGECYALRQFDEGDQVYIYYGPRSNADFLLNNGFVYPANQSDRIETRIGFSKTDPLYAKRCDVLSKLSLLPSGRFHLHKGDDPVDSELLAYIRVFQMSEDELDDRLSSRERIGKLRDFGEIVTEENEKKTWNFIDTRCKLLLRAYPQTAQEDRELLKGETYTDTKRMLIQLRHMEKNILQATIEFIDRYMQELEMTIQEQKVEELKLVDRKQRLAKITDITDQSEQSIDQDDIDIDSITALEQK